MVKWVGCLLRRHERTPNASSNYMTLTFALTLTTESTDEPKHAHLQHDVVCNCCDSRPSCTMPTTKNAFKSHAQYIENTVSVISFATVNRNCSGCELSSLFTWQRAHRPPHPAQRFLSCKRKVQWGFWVLDSRALPQSAVPLRRRPLG
eukprot:6164231-Amphidinium_carterae.1